MWSDAQLFDALGVGLGLDEMYNVMLAVKRLGEDPSKGVATVRFMGKFLGITADYYVFETTLTEPPEEPEEGVLRECSADVFSRLGLASLCLVLALVLYKLTALMRN